METYLRTGRKTTGGLEKILREKPTFWGMEADLEDNMVHVIFAFRAVFDTVTRLVRDGTVILSDRDMSAVTIAADALKAAANDAARRAGAMPWWRLVLAWWL